MCSSDLNAFQDGLTSGLQLTQIGQSRLKLAQGGVVQALSGFFSISSDERNGGAPIEEVNCGLDLRGTRLKLSGDLDNDLMQGDLQHVHEVAQCIGPQTR